MDRMTGNDSLVGGDVETGTTVLSFCGLACFCHLQATISGCNTVNICL